jgi:hypothetical protein
MKYNRIIQQNDNIIIYQDKNLKDLYVARNMFINVILQIINRHKDLRDLPSIESDMFGFKFT